MGRPFGVLSDEPVVLAQCWNSVDGLFAILKSGAVEWSARLDFPGPIKRAPAHITDDVITAVGAGSHIIFLTRFGTLRTWEARSGTPGKDIPGFDSIVEIDGGDNFAIARRKDGKVLIWGGNSSLSPPDDLKPTVGVRAGSHVCAAQHPDGTWTSWGGTPTITNLVRLAGKAIDLDLDCGSATTEEEGERGHFVVWISPSEERGEIPILETVDWEGELALLVQRFESNGLPVVSKGAKEVDQTALNSLLGDVQAFEKRSLEAREEALAIKAHLLAKDVRSLLARVQE